VVAQTCAKPTETVAARQQPAAHRSQPWPHAYVHWLFWQLAVASGNDVVHTSQLGPQPAMESLGRHWFPQRWYPVSQVKSQVLPTVHWSVAFAGSAGHVAHCEPHRRVPAEQVR